MATFWFCSAPLYSHTDWGGYLKTAQALAADGHHVIWVSGSAIAEAVRAAGIEFAPVRATGWLWPPPPAPDISLLAPMDAVMLRYRRALDTWMSEDLIADAVDALLELAAEIGAPDCIVTDPFLTAAALVAEKLAVPLAVCGWIAQRELREDFLFPVQKSLGDESRARLDRLCARFGLVGSNFSGGATPSILSPYLHISYFSASWYGADEDNTLPQTLFVGGAPVPATDAPPAWMATLPADAPLAVITLGTTFAGEAGFFSWSAQAARRAGLFPIVAIGWHPLPPDEKAKLLASLPPGTRLLNWIPFAHVLPRARLIIHHGGMGTTHAACIYGVPQIAVPHAADQRGNARRVAQAKVGLSLSAHEVKQGMLMQGARAIVGDAVVAENARQLAEAFAALGGPARAAAAIAALVGGEQASISGTSE